MEKVNRDIERVELCVFEGRKICSSALRKNEIDRCLNCTKDECDNCIRYMEAEAVEGWKEIGKKDIYRRKAKLGQEKWVRSQNI